jgi:hypothetical protein
MGAGQTWWKVIMETALYFPYIRVPKTSWFTQVLLYWDNAATMVPRSLLMRPDSPDRYYKVGKYMTQLEKVGLLEYISEFELLKYGDSFLRNSLDLVNEREHQLRLDQRPLQYTHLHPGKASDRLFRRMEEAGLAKRSTDDEWMGWWSVEETLADQYMAYLASTISSIHKDTYPVTDKAVAIASLSSSPDDVMTRLQELRYAVITSALPAPAWAVAPKELRKFKDKHQDQLRRLRHHVDGRLADLAAIDDAALREVKANSVLEEIRDDVAVLSEKMTRRNWGRIVLIGVGGVVGAALATASAVSTAGGTLALGLAVGGGTASLGSATYQATEIFRQPRYNKRAPLAYAALASKLKGS